MVSHNTDACEKEKVYIKTFSHDISQYNLLAIKADILPTLISQLL